MSDTCWHCPGKTVYRCHLYHVERCLREILITRIAPISPHLILCYIAERVLGLPKSY